jgi:murein DD-endopeptidase MepM/ murein hydrolase activator NlpD
MILSTLFVLASAPAVPPARNAMALEVGVPFACGRVYPVSQGHDTGSHLQNDTYAWDFRMPVGTPVVSAQEGVVRMARGDSNQGACDPKMAQYANYVVVSHQGGIETQYLHFSTVVVKPGERVRKGQLLGYSGNTGWSCGPHLHFKVARSVGSGWNNPSVPASISGYGDPVRDTLVAAPACQPEDNMPVMAANDAARGNESLSPVGAPPREGEQAAGGVPAGVKAILGRVASESASKPEEVRAANGEGGSRQARDVE